MSPRSQLPPLPGASLNHPDTQREGICTPRGMGQPKTVTERASAPQKRDGETQSSPTKGIYSPKKGSGHPKQPHEGHLLPKKGIGRPKAAP